MNQKPINFALVGLGYHSKKNYVPYLLNKKNIYLKAICDLSTKKAQIIDSFPNIPFFENLADILNNKEIDAIIISTPHNLHFTQAYQCLKNGVNLFIDKPLSLLSHEAKALYEISKNTKRILYSAVPRRHSKLNSIILNYICTGKLGQVHEFQFDYYRPYYQGFKNSWRNQLDCGGGVLADAGYHLIDLLMRFKTSPVCSIKCHLEKHDFQVDVIAKVFAKMKNKSTANISLSLIGPKEILCERITVIGSKAILFYNRIKVFNSSENVQLLYISPKGIQDITEKENNNFDQKPLIDFIELCRSNKNRNPDIEIDLNIIEFIQRAYNDAENHK